MITSNYVIGLCIHYTALFIFILEYILSNYIKKKPFTVKEYAVLCRQQPHTTRVYHIS